MKNLRTAVVMQAAYTQGTDDSPALFVGVVRYIIRKAYDMPMTQQIPNAMIVDFIIANFDAITE